MFTTKEIIGLVLSALVITGLLIFSAEYIAAALYVKAEQREAKRVQKLDEDISLIDHDWNGFKNKSWDAI